MFVRRDGLEAGAGVDWSREGGSGQPYRQRDPGR